MNVENLASLAMLVELVGTDRIPRNYSTVHAVQTGSYNWMKSGPSRSSTTHAEPRRRSKKARLRTSSIPDPPTDSVQSSGPSDVERSYDWAWPGDAQEPLTSQLTSTTEEIISHPEIEWLQTVYERGWEAVFGSWIGRNSNPFAFGDQSLLDVVHVCRLCGQLDKWIANGDDPSAGAIIDFGASPTSSKHDTDLQIDRYLEYTIQAFAARWLPLASNTTTPSTACSEAVRSLWRRAHRNLLKIINRPCYRSMLTLLLFALTPIPVGISEDEELDGVSGQVCVHAALQQIQTLRARSRSLQFNGTRVNLAAPVRNTATSPSSIGSSNFIIAESAAYWAALTFDTSASLTLSCRPLLSSGLFGYECEPSWRMIRTCREIFRDMTKTWHDSTFELTTEKANQIVSAGAAWKLLVWKLTANLKESLRDGHTEIEVSKAFNAVSDAIDQFNDTYRDLLTACQTRIQFFSQETKLRWYGLMLHLNLCILMVSDMLIATNRDDLLLLFSAKSVNAESWVMNCLVFGLSNKYTLQLPAGFTATASKSDTVTVPLVAIDPYAHHVVAAVKLMQQAIDRDLRAGKIGSDAYSDMLTTLMQTLEHLPQCSKSVQSARADFATAGVPPLAPYP
ncbi:hypothetical protein B0A52_05872 [Exophiala mesophila]|uniref:Transcription factor domain-containing protein n=1 Tax=Exophiala mesophila TaxID=212818 RepID=A0A438N3Q8_EXOME|nr:hypothetical protein B0A52_05872 [Exophiala mesophila]